MDKQKEINLNNHINALTRTLFDAGVPKPKVLELVSSLYDAISDCIDGKNYNALKAEAARLIEGEK